MEELQDAIEDAQYVNAIATQEDGPRPVLPWEMPSEEQLASWKAKKLAQDPNSFTIDWICQISSIGLFLWSQYVKANGTDYVRINFCEEVARFKKLRGWHRLEKARWIATVYFVEPPPPAPALSSPSDEFDAADAPASTEAAPLPPAIPPDAHNTVQQPGLPPRTEIDEYNLERRPSSKMNLTSEEMSLMVKMGMDYPTCSQTVLGVKGPLLQEILKRVGELERLDAIRKTDSMPVYAAIQEAAEDFHGDLDDSTERSALDFLPDDNVMSKNPNLGPVFDENQPLDASAKTTATLATTSVSQDAVVVGSDDSMPAPPTNSSERAASMYEGDDHKLLSMRDLTRRLRSDNVIGDDVFDRAELVVWDSLKRDFGASFLQDSPEFVKFCNFLWYQDRRVVPDDFFVMRVLGRGGFGLVTACKKGTSGKLYAMKVMNKKRIKIRKSEQLALNERQALAAVESNFVVNLKYSFHSRDDIYLILDLMTGGDLGYHLQQKGRFPKRECQYYAARIMLGLQALHDQKYVYRDLKPENCLLADDGRVKITDLGLATRITPTLHGAAGTRGYWAPEMLRRDKKGKRLTYCHAVDWFSFGCCLAEFISGSNPFRSDVALNFGMERGKQTREKAIDCATLEMDPEFSPEKFESDAADLCRRLLDKNEKQRLGAVGCEEIMAHPWFKNINWESIISDRKRPPFIPAKDVNAASQSEIGNFAEDKTYQETSITAEDEKHYQGWDWTNPHAFAAEVIEFLIYERETGEPLVPMAQHPSCCCVIL